MKELMSQRKGRDRVIAEITLSHLSRLVNKHGCSVSREQAFTFIIKDRRTFEMWKQMMQAGENFIVRSLLGRVLTRSAVLTVFRSTRSGAGWPLFRDSSGGKASLSYAAFQFSFDSIVIRKNDLASTRCGRGAMESRLLFQASCQKEAVSVSSSKKVSMARHSLGSVAMSAQGCLNRLSILGLLRKIWAKKPRMWCPHLDNAGIEARSSS
jgi:hypothetical protein